MFSEALLRITQRLAKVGGWAVTFGEQNEVFWSPGTFEIYECDGDVPPSYADIVSCRKPAYRALAQAHMTNCVTRRVSCEYEAEIVTFKGTHKFIRVAMEPKLDEA